MFGQFWLIGRIICEVFGLFLEEISSQILSLPILICIDQSFFLQKVKLFKHFKGIWVLGQNCFVSKETTEKQLPEGCFGPTKYDNSGTFAQICL